MGAYHGCSFLSLFRILRWLVASLNVRRHQVDDGCQIVLRRVVLALPNIPREVRQDELLNSKLQLQVGSNPSQSLKNAHRVPVHVHGFMLQPLCRNSAEEAYW